MDGREQLRADLERLLQRLLGLTHSEELNSLAGADLSWSQVRVTMLLACSEQLAIGAVAERLGVSIHSAGRTIDQLVDLGIVNRLECPTDRRFKLVSLTRRGLEIIDQHVAGRRHAVQRFVDRLPVDRADALADALRPILAGDYLRPLSAEELTVDPTGAAATGSTAGAPATDSTTEAADSAAAAPAADSPTTPALSGR